MKIELFKQSVESKFPDKKRLYSDVIEHIAKHRLTLIEGLPLAFCALKIDPESQAKMMFIAISVLVGSNEHQDAIKLINNDDLPLAFELDNRSLYTLDKMSVIRSLLLREDRDKVNVPVRRLVEKIEKLDIKIPDIETIVKFIVTHESDSNQGRKRVPGTNCTVALVANGAVIEHVILKGARTYKIGRGGDKKVKTGLYVSKKNDLAQPIADLNSKGIAAWERRDIIQSVDEHPNVEGYSHIFRYKCPHGKVKVRLYQRLFKYSLEQLINNRALTLPNRIKALKQIGSGLKHIHDQGVIYRDMKPDNILVDGSLNEFVLSDLDYVEKSENLKAQSYCGTKIYFPLQQYFQKKSQTKNWDAYSFILTVLDLFVDEPKNHDKLHAYLHAKLHKVDTENVYIDPMEIVSGVIKILEEVDVDSMRPTSLFDALDCEEYGFRLRRSQQAQTI